MIRRALALTVAVLFLPITVHADGISWRELRIPMAEAGKEGLEAMLVYPSEPGRHPLILLNHGSPRSADDRPDMTAAGMWPQARELARRGWTVAMVLRRGYGSSGGEWAEGFGECTRPDYLAAAHGAVADLRAAVTYLSTQPEVDARKIVSIGVSAGGFATVALAADPPPGLIAAVSFAGGRGSQSADTVCDEKALIAAFATFGMTSRIPMLWVYAKNDHFFGPKLAQRLLTAFVNAGGKVSYVTPAAFGEDGHLLFSGPGIALWTPLVDAFFAEHGLTLRPAPLADTLPDLAAPPGLDADGKKAFAAYLAAAPHKAFAVSPKGGFGWRSARHTAADAKDGAVANCREQTCRVAAVDDVLTP